MASIIMVVAIALVVVILSWMLFMRWRLNLPPGPTALPIIGCLHLLGPQPYKSFAELAKKYGPLMSVPLGQHFCVVASSPDAAKEFLKMQDANFCARPSMRGAHTIHSKELIFHDLTPDIRHMRKILVSELISAKRLEASQYIRMEENAYMLSSIAKQKGRPIRVVTHINIMFSNILSRMLLNKRFMGAEQENSGSSSEVQEFMEIVEEMAYCLGTIHLKDIFSFLPEWFDPQGLDKRFKRLRARMDVLFSSMIEQHKGERRTNPISDDQKTMLDVVLEQLQRSDLGITEEHIFGIIWNAFGAGTDTTTLTGEWTMAEVLRNPTLQEKAREELDRVVGPDRLVQESDIPQLKFIEALVKECFRLHPVVPLLIVPHQSIKATKVFGYDIPAVTRVFVNVWGMGRDAAIWEKPLEFTPERFLDGAHVTTDVLGQHFELIPFGAGRRQCPGMVFGVLAVYLLIANLLHAFDWSLPDGMTPEKLDMSDGVGLTPPMLNHLMAVAKPRLAPHLYELLAVY